MVNPDEQAHSHTHKGEQRKEVKQCVLTIDPENAVLQIGPLNTNMSCDIEYMSNRERRQGKYRVT